MAAQTILVVDDDLGFVMWLGRMLADMGYRALPARNGSEAIGQIERTKIPVDLVMVNLALPGGRALVKTLARLDPPARVVSIQEPTVPLVAETQAVVTLRKPGASEPLSREMWLEKLTLVLAEAQGAQ